jgi:5-methylcytosine-specific restriction endonuclease McrA
MASETIERAAAQAQGLKLYFTGRSCKFGHIAQRTSWDGRCVECTAIWRKENKARYDAARRKWDIKNPDKRRASRRRWEKTDAGKASHKKWNAANREKVLSRGRRWGRKHPDKIAAKTARRRARLIGLTDNYTAGDLRDIFDLQKGRCAYCRRKLRKQKHIDHIIALACNGTNERRNIQILCKKCNLDKGAADPLVFARSLGKLL